MKSKQSFVIKYADFTATTTILRGFINSITIYNAGKLNYNPIKYTATSLLLSNNPSQMKHLDKTDRAILQQIQLNGRISNVELSKRVNLSPSPCLDRVKRLEKEGYIERYGAVLNPTMLGYDMFAYVSVTLDKTTNDSFELFQKEIIEIKEVFECDMVAGGFDYLLKLCITNMKNYRTVLGQIAELSGVSHTNTYIVIENIKKNMGMHIS